MTAVLLGWRLGCGYRFLLNACEELVNRDSHTEIKKVGYLGVNEATSDGGKANLNRLCQRHDIVTCKAQLLNLVLIFHLDTMKVGAGLCFEMSPQTARSDLESDNWR
jgi:hypothetical protein